MSLCVISWHCDFNSYNLNLSPMHSQNIQEGEGVYKITSNVIIIFNRLF